MEEFSESLHVSQAKLRYAPDRSTAVALGGSGSINEIAAASATITKSGVINPMDTLETELSSPVENRARTTLFFLVFVHLVVDWMAPAVFYRVSSPTAAEAPVLLGLIMGQMTLLAAWISLSSDPLLLRLSTAFILATAIVFAALIGSQVTGDEYSITHSPALVLRGGIMFMAGIIALQIPLWTWVTRNWQLSAPWNTGPRARTVGQFNLSFMIGGITTLAFALGVGRLLVPPGALVGISQIPAREISSLAGRWAISLAVIVVLAFPCLWGAYFRFHQLFWFVVAWSVTVFAVSWIERMVLVDVLRVPVGGSIGGLSSLAGLFSRNLALCGSVLATLMVLRWVGFRLRQAQASDPGHL